MGSMSHLEVISSIPFNCSINAIYAFVLLEFFPYVPSCQEYFRRITSFNEDSPGYFCYQSVVIFVLSLLPCLYILHKLLFIEWTVCRVFRRVTMFQSFILTCYAWWSICFKFTAELMLFVEVPTSTLVAIHTVSWIGTTCQTQGIGLKGREMALVWHEKASRTAL